MNWNSCGERLSRSREFGGKAVSFYLGSQRHSLDKMSNISTTSLNSCCLWTAEEVKEPKQLSTTFGLLVCIYFSILAIGGVSANGLVMWFFARCPMVRHSKLFLNSKWKLQKFYNKKLYVVKNGYKIMYMAIFMYLYFKLSF